MAIISAITNQMTVINAPNVILEAIIMPVNPRHMSTIPTASERALINFIEDYFFSQIGLYSPSQSVYHIEGSDSYVHSPNSSGFPVVE